MARKSSARYADHFATDDPGEKHMGYSRLGMAACLNDFAEISRLLALGMRDPNEPSDYGNKTPLATTAYHGHVESLRLLMADPRVDIERRDLDGQTAAHHAVVQGNLRALKILARRCDLGAEDSDGMTPLGAAAWLGRLPCVKFLASRVDPSSADSRGMTPLMHAAGGGELAAVRFLLPLSDLAAPSKEGENPLMRAAGFGHLACVTELLPHFDPSARNSDGLTAADLAREGVGAGWSDNPAGLARTAKFLEAHALALREMAEISSSVAAIARKAPGAVAMRM